MLLTRNHPWAVASDQQRRLQGWSAGRAL